MLSRNEKRLTRQRRTKSMTSGTAERPRVSVFKSQNSISIQIIDDKKNVTLISSDSRKETDKKFDVAFCEKFGEALAADAIKKGIKEVVFDRSGYRYHGKVKAVADGLRKGGLKL